MQKKAYIRTFGCQMNMHDSEKMAGILFDEGYDLTDNPKAADLIIFNTCSIRQKAEQKFQSELGRIKSLKKTMPRLKIAVAGCIAQKKGREILNKNRHVDHVLGPQNLHRLKDIVNCDKVSVFTEDNPDISLSDLPALRKDSVKTWVSIMYGCDNFCSYCIVPYTRGREKSRPSSSVYHEVCRLAAEGFKEVTLLGQNVNSYKSDVDFPGLLGKINSVEGINRIRFVTSHPKNLSEDLINCMGELQKVCEHIHLPLQSGSDRVLRLMNRGYTIEDYMEKVGRLREKVPGIAITTDIIAGFPGESEYDHALTLKALRSIDFDGIFAFNFSPRPGTAAAEMENDVPYNVKSKRLEEILSVQDEITSGKNRQLEGTMQEVLIEGESKTDKEKLTGRTRTNKIVNITGEVLFRGALVDIKITKALRHSLEGIYSSSPHPKK